MQDFVEGPNRVLLRCIFEMIVNVCPCSVLGLRVIDDGKRLAIAKPPFAPFVNDRPPSISVLSVKEAWMIAVKFSPKLERFLPKMVQICAGNRKPRYFHLARRVVLHCLSL
mmetsp:Transcript_36618/g.73425  ORF Transcript_36618/g.73425 Transcript_36618/m.73425 type:complete len:111 (+) Transcript_36618:783-1115(+)